MPVIVFTLLGLLWSLHPLVALTAVALASMGYYFRLSKPFAVGMLLMAAADAGHPGGAAAARPSCRCRLRFSSLAWIGQFIGHKIEGKKPSFFDDLRFLLIGPLFVLSFLYRRLHLAY